MDIIQERFVKNSIVSLESSSLVFLLNVSEMAIVLKVESLVSIETLESFVPLDLVLLIQLHGSLGHDVAVVVNGSYVVVQPVDFFEVNFLNI